MSTLQVANIHLESTGNNRIQYAGSNVVNIVAANAVNIAAAGVNVAAVNSTALSITKALAANGSVGTAAQVLLSGGPGGNAYWGAGGGGGYAIQVFTANGTWTATSPNLKSVKVSVVGGGAGGGAGSIGPIPAPVVTIGGLGGSGGVSIGSFPVAANPALSAPVTVTVGLGGAASAAGTTSSFGALASGTGGTAASGTTNGSGGSGSGGQWNIPGVIGSRTANPLGAAGFGLTSTGQPILSLGTNMVSGPGPSVVAGVDGRLYGGGATGGIGTSGGAGANGVVIVEEFY